MRFQSILAAAVSLLGVAHAAPSLAPRDDIPKDMKPSDDVWRLTQVGQSTRTPQYAAIKDKEIKEIKDLYLEASKAFNFIKVQDNILTSDTKSALVAAYYNPKDKTVSVGTIPRQRDVRDDMLNGNTGKVWQAHHKKENLGNTLHAEDLAYFWNERENPIDLDGKDPKDYKYGKDEEGSAMVAVWGVKGSNSEAVKEAAGRPWEQCGTCSKLAKSLGVYMKAPK
jgi:hypothetical protein